MAKSSGDNAFPLSEMLTQGFEQTRKSATKSATNVMKGLSS
jgi:hypothetical protein